MSTSQPTQDTSALTSKLANLSLTGELPQPDAGISSVPPTLINEAVASGDQRRAQIAQPQMTTMPSFLKDAAHSTVQKHSQGIIDGNVIKEIRSTISRGGYVYIFHSLDRKLVKIGKATDVNRRKKQILVGCQLPDLEEVPFDCSHIQYPERVEKLVHLELQNFQVKFNCKHLRRDSSEAVEKGHREWFDVPKDVAVKSVELWSTFVEQAYTAEGTIKEHWARMATSLPKPSRSERESLPRGMVSGEVGDIKLHHQLRHERYRKWVEDGESQ